MQMQYAKSDKYSSERSAFVIALLCALFERVARSSFVHPSQETIMSPASTSLDLVHSSRGSLLVGFSLGIVALQLIHPLSATADKSRYRTNCVEAGNMNEMHNSNKEKDSMYKGEYPRILRDTVISKFIALSSERISCNFIKSPTHKFMYVTIFVLFL